MKNRVWKALAMAVAAGTLMMHTLPAEASEVAQDPEAAEALAEDVDYILGRPMTEEEIAEQMRLTEEGLKNNGYMEEEVDGEAGDIRIAEEEEMVRGVLPSYYDSRNYGYVTSVKDQNPYGTCWAFSSISLMESDLLHDGGTFSGDLSEAHLIYFAFHSAPEPLNNQYNDSMRNSDFVNYGGNSYASYATMAAWRGAVSETAVPYSIMPNRLSQDTFTAYGQNNAHLQGYYRIDGGNRDLIKKAIIEHGAVGGSYYEANGYRNYETAAYYCNYATGTNHAITIVGWDDNYSTANFNASCRPAVNGAWIVKNSWGAYWGDGGYFYLSYEDATVKNFFAYDAEPVTNYNNCYQYDLSATGGTRATWAQKAASVFTVKANPGKMEELGAVSIAMTQQTNVTGTVQIYKNLKNASDPTSGTAMLASPQRISTTLAGYYTFRLNTPVKLNQGETFSVVFTFDELTLVDRERNYTNGNYVVTPSSKAGESFTIQNGSYWNDIGSGNEGNLRIKAFTKNLNETPFSDKVYRVYGANRFATSFKIADALKASSCRSKFDTVIVANGMNFADALAGSYLAYVKQAPILMTNGTNAPDVQNYIKSNLKSGGTVYLLGGVNAVPEAIRTGLSGCNVVRLGGANRYETNLNILKEAGVTNEEILVCTGTGFADSLSGSAVKKPILLVGKELNPQQQEYLASLSGDKFYILGGTSAVSDSVAAVLGNYGSVERIGGANRYETSVMIAQRFFSNPKSAVIAYAKNFPDGLCGGPLAASEGFGGPLILTAQGQEAAAVGYLMMNGVKQGAVLGGDKLITNAMTVNLFGLNTYKIIITW